LDSTRDTGDSVNEIDDFLDNTHINCNYIDLVNCGEELSKCCDSHQYCVLHINIHSIPAKFDQLKDILRTAHLMLLYT